MTIKSGVATALLLSFAALAGAPALAAAPPAFTEGVVLVGYKAGTPQAARANARANLGVASVRALSRLDRNAEKLQLAKGASVDATIKALLRDPNVRYAHPDYRVKAILDSNDPYFTDGSLWGMYGDTSTPANSFGSQAAEVWAQGYVGSQQVFVGIIDEGVQFAHPDLADNVWTNPHEIAGDGIDNDGNGYIDDVHGWDFFSNDATVFDGGTGDTHGTHVAGTIGARGGNGQGVVGVNWEVGMISAKFLGPNGGAISDAVAAVDYLTDLKLRHNINIVASSNSWGGGGFSQAMLDAMNRAGDAGILFIAAAGNDASNTDSVANYPSNYQCTTASRSWDCVVSVASITSTGGLSSFSNYGATTVDLGAPGSSINSTLPDSTYGNYSGTSMATPHVSGAVALCASVDQTQSAQDLRSAVLNSTAPTASLAGRTTTGGRLDANAMLAACHPPAGPVTGAPSGLTATSSGTAAVRLDWLDGTTGESYVEVQRGDASCAAFTSIATLAAGSTSYTAIGLQADTSYCFRVRAGNRYPSTTAWSDSSLATTAPIPPPYQCRATQDPWQNISGSPALSLADDAEVAVALPFTFSFYGTPVTSVKLSSNGFLRLDGGTATAYTNASLPSAAEPNALIAPFWDDLNPATVGAVRTAVVGSAPNRRFVVSWEGVPHFSAAGSAVSFQATLEEDSGQIVFNYADVIVGNVAYDRGSSATVGIESPLGDAATLVSYNTASLSDGMALRCAALPAATSAPAVPTGVVATATSASTVAVVWADVATETGYSLERATGTGAYGVIATLAADTTSYVDSGLVAGTAYNYRLRAVNAAGYSGYSGVASALTPAPAPATPTGLTATAASATSITVGWSDVAGETRYELQRSPDGTNWTTLVTTAANVVSHSDAGLVQNTTYRYRLRAGNAAGDSAWSVTAQASTPYATPSTPTGLAASAASATQVNLTWADAANNETGYSVERAQGTGAYAVIATLAANSTSHADSGRTAGTQYSYRVRAVNTSVYSAYSNVATVTTPAAGIPTVPTGLAATSVTATSVTLGWNAVTGAATYTLQWSANGSTSWTSLATQAGRTYTHTGRTGSTTYYYRVRANSTAGSSAYSAVVSATTLAAPPAAPTTVAATRSGGTVTVTWRDRSSNETGFDIGRQTSVGGVWSATTVVGSVAANTTRFSQAPGTGVYRYYVRSKNATLTSAWVGPSATQTVP